MNRERTAAEVGEIIRDMRLRHGDSQLGFAKAAGVDPKTLRALESGTGWPKDHSLAKIEQVLGWGVGSIKSIRDGGEPTLLHDRHTTSDLPESPNQALNHLLKSTSPEAPSEFEKLFKSLFQNYVPGRLSASQLQELADKEWVSERLSIFSPDERQSVKDFIDQIGRQNYSNWESMFDDQDADSDV